MLYMDSRCKCQKVNVAWFLSFTHILTYYNLAVSRSYWLKQCITNLLFHRLYHQCIHSIATRYKWIYLYSLILYRHIQRNVSSMPRSHSSVKWTYPGGMEKSFTLKKYKHIKFFAKIKQNFLDHVKCLPKFSHFNMHNVV